LRRRASPNEFRIATLPSISQLWLSERLPALRRASPGLSISVTAMERPPNLMREPFDLAIFFCAESTGMFTRVLAEDSLFPVCAPEIADRLTCTRDLLGETLLHDASWREDWSTWLAASRIDGIATTSGPVFSLYSLAVEEAMHGAGVLIGHAPLVATALASGALVAPFAHIARSATPLVAMSLEPPRSGTSMDQILNQLVGTTVAAGSVETARPGSSTAPPER